MKENHTKCAQVGNDMIDDEERLFTQRLKLTHTENMTL
jgi:hypothetical protein